MKDSLYILTKYWREHKKSLAALLFSGVLLCAVVCCIYLNVRREFIIGNEDWYDLNGRYTLLVTSDRTDVIDLFSKEDTVRGEIAVCGMAGIGKERFEVGVLNDPENLAHLPLSEGRLPETEGEIAAFSAALERMGFFGSVGDELTLNTGTYKLVGIFKDKSYAFRKGTRLELERAYAGNVFYDDDRKSRYFFPMLFVGGEPKQAPDYTWVMLDNIKHVTIPEKMRSDRNEFSDEFNAVLRASAIEFKTDNEYSYENWAYNFMWSKAAGFDQNQHKMMPIYISACIIAALSVLAVMRNIFAERENTVRMLSRIGMSKRRIGLMYTLEYICLAVLQAVIGIALGSAAHLAIYRYYVTMLGEKDISGFTESRFASWLLPQPFVMGAVISAAVLLAGYVLAVLLSHIKSPSRREKKASSLRGCIGRIFRTRAVSVIQTAALALICFGTVYGYMLFHSTEGGYDPETGEFMSIISTQFGTRSQFDFEEDGIEEYYYASPAKTQGIGSFLFSIHSDRLNGIDDTTADTVENVTSHGELPQTFIVAEDSSLKNSIVFGSEEERQFFIDNSSDEGRQLLFSGKTLYKSPIALTDSQTIESLSQYVTAGEIDFDKLRSGEEIILVLKRGDSPLGVGETVTIGSAETENGFGISSLTLTDTKIGAVVTLQQGMDRILRYAVSAGDDYGLLTTASGASSLGLFGAKYTELFSKDTLGSKLPLGTGFTLTSYTRQRRDLFLQNASFYGSMGALVLLMSLLGFSAYFNGIGLKVRLKEYQISVMRSVGTPIKRLRRRLTLDSIRIPLISGAAAYSAVKLMQRIMLAAYNKKEELYRAASELGRELDKADIRDFDRVNKLQDQAYDIGLKYMTQAQMWFMNALIPTLIIFAVMCSVTILLTRKSFKMFTPDISGSLARGRKRR